MISWLFRSQVSASHGPAARPPTALAAAPSWGRRAFFTLLRRVSASGGHRQMQIDAGRCSDCGACVRACRKTSLRRSEVDGFVCYLRDARRCNGCGRCRRVCTRNALRIVTRASKAPEIQEVARLPVRIV